MATKLLIDGDIVAYRACFATEKTKYLVEHNDNYFKYDDAKAAKDAFTVPGVLWSRKELQPVEQAISIAHVMIKDIRDHYPDSSLEVFLSGVGNFRNSIATRASYKGNRPEKPKHLKAVMTELVKRGAILSAGEEADDLIGIAATANPSAVICSIDKDLMQLPGRHYNFVTKEELSVDPKTAALNLYAQVLSGDSTDNIPGLPGIGPVKAFMALANLKSPAECWAKCEELYTKEFGSNGLKYALECAQLVHIRRTPGIGFVPPVSTRIIPDGKENAPKEAKTLTNKTESSSRGIQKRTRKVDSGRPGVEGSAV